MARGFRRNEAVDAAVVRAAGAALSAEDMLAFARNRNEAIREAIAGRPDATFAALLALAQDSAVDVRCAVASNEAVAVAESVVDLLAGDRDGRVAAALVRNPAVSAATKERLRLRHEPDVVRAFAALDGTGDGHAGPALGARLRGVVPGEPDGDIAEPELPRHRTAPVRGFRGTPDAAD